MFNENLNKGKCMRRSEIVKEWEMKNGRWEALSHWGKIASRYVHQAAFSSSKISPFYDAKLLCF